MAEGTKKQATGRRKSGWTVFLVAPGSMGVLLAKLATFVSPDAVPYFAPFGLLFPVSLLLLVLGAAIRLLNGRPRGIVVPFLLLWWGAPEIVRTWGGWSSPAHASVPTAETPRQLSLLTWNVRQFDRYDWLGGERIKTQILKEIEAVDADVVCLQEAYLRMGFLTRPELWEAAGVSNWHRNFGAAVNPSDHFGLVTLSRHPIVGKREIWFEDDPGNACIITDIEVGGKDTIRVFNVHLSSNRFETSDLDAVRRGPDAEERARLWGRLRSSWEKRADQSRLLADEVAASPHPVILAGDFNDGPVSYAAAQFRPELHDAFAAAGSGIGATYIGKLPMLRIDHILYEAPLIATDFATLQPRLSDHRAVRAAFRW